MKTRIMLLCAGLVLVLGVNAQKNAVQTSSMKCEIKGNLDKNTSATKAYLLKVVGRSMECVDSADVKSGAFVLSEAAPTIPEVRYIKFKGIEASPVKVYMDADELTLSQNKTTKEFSISGSATNEARAQMEEETAAYRKQMEDAYARYKDKSLSEEQHKQAEKDYDESESKAVEIETKYLKENNANIMGLDLLAENCYNIDGPLVEGYLLKVADTFKETNEYKRLAKFVENEKKCMPGDDYHDIELKTPEGQTKKLSDFIKQDKYTIIDFWASWCGPCRAEMPNMVKIYKEFKDNGVEIVGISLDKDNEAWKKAIKDLGITWPQLSDLKAWQSKAAELYGVQAIPMTVIIAPNGRILKKNLRGEELYKAASGWASK